MSNTEAPYASAPRRRRSRAGPSPLATVDVLATDKAISINLTNTIGNMYKECYRSRHLALWCTPRQPRTRKRKPVKPRTRTRLTVGLVGLMATGITLVAAAPAWADYAPQPGDIVGVGGDTPQYALQFGADGDYLGDAGFNAAGAYNRLVVFDA